MRPEGESLRATLGAVGYGRPAFFIDWNFPGAPSGDTSVHIEYGTPTGSATFDHTFSAGDTLPSFTELLNSNLTNCWSYYVGGSNWLVVLPYSWIWVRVTGPYLALPMTVYGVKIRTVNAVNGDTVTVTAPWTEAGSYTYTKGSSYNQETRTFSTAAELADLISNDFVNYHISAAKVVEDGVDVVYVEVGRVAYVHYLSCTGAIAIESGPRVKSYPNVWSTRVIRSAFTHVAPDGSEEYNFCVIGDTLFADHQGPPGSTAYDQVFAPVFSDAADNPMLKLASDLVSVAQLYNTAYFTDGIDGGVYGFTHISVNGGSLQRPSFHKIGTEDIGTVTPPSLYLRTPDLIASRSSGGSPVWTTNLSGVTISWALDTSLLQYVVSTSLSGTADYLEVKLEATSQSAGGYAVLTGTFSSTVDFDGLNNEYATRGFLTVGDVSLSDITYVRFPKPAYNPRNIKIVVSGTSGEELQTNIEGDVLTSGASCFFETPVNFDDQRGAGDVAKGVKTIKFYIAPSPGGTVKFRLETIKCTGRIAKVVDVQSGVSYRNTTTNWVSRIYPGATLSKGGDISLTPHRPRTVAYTFNIAPKSGYETLVHVRTRPPGGQEWGSWRLVGTYSAGETTASLNTDFDQLELSEDALTAISTQDVKCRALAPISSTGRLVLLDVKTGGTRYKQRVWISNRIDPTYPLNVSWPELPPSGVEIPDDVRQASEYGLMLDISTVSGVVGAVEYGPDFYIFSPNAVHRLRGSSPTDWALSIVSDGIGCPSPFGVCSIEGGIAFFGSDGALYYLTVRAQDEPEVLTQFGTDQDAKMSSPIQWQVRKLLSTDYYAPDHVWVSRLHDFIVLSLAEPSNTEELTGRTYMYDFRRGKWFEYDAVVRGFALRGHRGSTQDKAGHLELALLAPHIFLETLLSLNSTDWGYFYEFPYIAYVLVPETYGYQRASGGTYYPYQKYQSARMKIGEPGQEHRVRRIVLTAYIGESNPLKSDGFSVTVTLGRRGERHSTTFTVSSGVTANSVNRLVFDMPSVNPGTDSWSPSFFWADEIQVEVSNLFTRRRVDIYSIEADVYAVRRVMD